ncbi:MULTISPECIES: AAA family ATPase [unclassified Mucilaginibacter]|uniref:AAA family ATPase n=1 Tax=unclassified Mucilaginibacter TaxID=2617802 RepID=UPI000962CAC6|nr:MULTISPECIES: AAA family ATPase [unclassified Mucilaginibacter]OJW17120.1 MAG: hypothetical protein BGO48_06055 [Mucilaginibacter sp. 44-25]PLW89212.1 MAG: hypothetical protein C0154_12705 [Mucilaginibacter sp.]HEK18843.1 ATP-binding protein [Bacteroidota bacterium]
MISKILLREKWYDSFQTIEADKTLKSLSKINIFIGSNNSGKSLFLRTLFSDSRLIFDFGYFNLPKVNEILRECRQKLIDINSGIGNDTLEYVIDDIREIDFVSAGFDVNNEIHRQLHDITNFTPINYINTIDQVSFIERVRAIGKTYGDKMKALLANKSFNFKPESKYIPTLRGLRPIGEKQKDAYLDLTVKDYFTGAGFDGNIKDKIFTGLGLYQELQRLLLGTKEDREKVKNFERFLSERFFGSQEVNLIPRINEDVVFVRIGDHEEKAIFQLGDGIQSIIIITYPLFFERDRKCLFFIEEPEHYLHPGFQRILMETMLSFKEHQFFITTHSNHLLDMTLERQDISVYMLRKQYSETFEPSFSIENVENDDVNILAEIGVRNSSVFLSNCTIWVEGITDRIYIRKYLDIWQKDLKVKYVEDLHYSFVEYAGNNITHWSFLENADENCPNIEVTRLCSSLFLITDSDGYGLTEELSQGKKALRQQQLKDNLGERYYCLEAREIENLLSEQVISKTIEVLESGSGVDTLKISEGNYQKKKLGKYLDDVLINPKRKYGDSSGTIKDKLAFAKKATSFINDIADMSEEAKALTEKLYNFIKSNNP